MYIHFIKKKLASLFVCLHSLSIKISFRKYLIIINTFGMKKLIYIYKAFFFYFLMLLCCKIFNIFQLFIIDLLDLDSFLWLFYINFLFITQ